MDITGSPIGIFDSGVGGTSIWRAINRLLPGESTLYLADSRYAPYGRKSKEEIINLSVKNTRLLIEKKCKLIVVACNTATTTAISHLRENYPLPFIGIEPAIKPAALQSRTRVVGVLATRGTLSSELFHNTASLYGSGISVIEQVGDGLVSLIEQGKIQSPEMSRLLTGYLQPMIDRNIDYLVLGCTHYTYLIPKIRNILPPSVIIIDSGDAVARQTKAVLEKKGWLNSSATPPTYRFYSNLDAILLRSFLPGDKTSLTVEYMEF